jgi:hypothetical protein
MGSSSALSRCLKKSGVPRRHCWETPSSTCTTAGEEIKVVDFEGKTQLKMHSRGACDQGNRSSADGRRMLFDFTVPRCPAWKTYTKVFGRSSPWERREPKMSTARTSKYLIRSAESPASTGAVIFLPAAISPSGEFVAIASENTLSIYRVPTVCQSEPSDRVYHWRNIVPAH